MGTVGSVCKGPIEPKSSLTSEKKQPMNDTGITKAETAMDSSKHVSSHDTSDADDPLPTIREIIIKDGVFQGVDQPIECDETVEFKIQENGKYDIFEVYKDGNDYFRVVNGFELLSIKKSTPVHMRRITLSYLLPQSELALYFCVTPATASSSERKQNMVKLKRSECEKNTFIVRKPAIKFLLNDEEINQKVYLHKDDCVEFEWTSDGAGYRMEEKQYCPVSGGLFSATDTVETAVGRVSSKGKFSKTFDSFGTTFFFRYNHKNDIMDVSVCLVHDSYKRKTIEIKDDKITPSILWLDEDDWVRFEWNGKHKQTVIQIEPFSINENKKSSIELRNPDENFFWPHEPCRRGVMLQKFVKAGVYCFKTGDNQIGTIIVQPRKPLHRIPLRSDDLTFKLRTNDIVQFEWQKEAVNSESMLITIDADSSVVPESVGGLSGVFDCVLHKCSKVDAWFQRNFYLWEKFLLVIPQHGIYNFSYDNNPDISLLTLTVESDTDSHRITYNEENQFDPNILVINRFDQVWFDAASSTVAEIYRADQFGHRLPLEKPLFQPQENSINYYMKEFQQIGVYYFTTSINAGDKKNAEYSNRPLTVIVMPEIRFHYRLVSNNSFDSEPILTNLNDFVVWKFSDVVSSNIIQLSAGETIDSLTSCLDRASKGRNRKCLGVECTGTGVFYFACPEFERVTRSEQTRLVSTLVVDPPFGQNSVIVGTHRFVPDVLHIAQDDTVVWIVAQGNQLHQYAIVFNDDKVEPDEDEFVDQSEIATYVEGADYLYTFSNPGVYYVYSSEFESALKVVVHSKENVQSQKRQLQQPRIVEDIDITSKFDTEIHLACPNKQINIIYTLDGELPTRHFANIEKYDSKKGIRFKKPGLHIIRAYAVDDDRISSAVLTSSPTFVLQSKENEDMQKRQSLWSACKISLSIKLKYPNKIYGTIKAEPEDVLELISRFELVVNDVAQKTPIEPTKLQFSADGFSGGEYYDVFVIAYPDDELLQVDPVSSNKRAFDVPRQVQGGGPLISLAVPNDPNAVQIMWAHLGDHVSEYAIFVDNIETKIINQREFNDFYSIRLHDAQEGKKYLFHIEARINGKDDLLKSNTIQIRLPLQSSLKQPTADNCFPYITINDERALGDGLVEESMARLSSSRLSLRSNASSPAASSRRSHHSVSLNDEPVHESTVIHQRTPAKDKKQSKSPKHRSATPTEQEAQEQESKRTSISTGTSTNNETDNNRIVDPLTIERSKTTLDQRNKQKSVILSDASKRRAQILLNKLTQAIEARNEQLNSNAINPHALDCAIDSTDLPRQPADIRRRPEAVSIANGYRNAVPTITYRRNKYGVTLFWKKRNPSFDDQIKNYLVMLDDKPYGRLVRPHEDLRFQVNLVPGKHKLHVQALAVEGHGESFKSNTLKVDVQSAADIDYEEFQHGESQSISVASVLDGQEAPIPRLSLQIISSSSIRITWYFNRPLPRDIFVALYEVHIRGQDFPEEMHSDTHFVDDGYIEHVWYVNNSPLEIQGISERQDYTVFVKALFYAQSANEGECVITTSEEVITSKIDQLANLVPRPRLQVENVGLQTATLSWKIDPNFDESLIKGFRIFINSKPSEILSPEEHHYELRGLKPGTINEIQVGVTSNNDFIDEKVSEPIRIVCPPRPHPPTIQAVRPDKPFAIRIQWNNDENNDESITAYKVFLNGQLHEEIDINGRSSFKSDFTQLKAGESYSIYIKSYYPYKRDGYTYQCQVESLASNELSLKCATPPRGTQPKLQRMTPKGIEITWDASVQSDDMVITGYQILKDNRAITKVLSADTRSAFITDLHVGNRYYFQMVPIHDLPGGTVMMTGEEYDPYRHGHYLPGPKLDVEYTDLVLLPAQFWIENVTGHSALVCWSPIDESESRNRQPDKYKLSIWDNEDYKDDNPKIEELPKNKTSAKLTELKAHTTYSVQLEAYINRSHPASNASYIVSAQSDIRSFQTGSAPDAPSRLYLIASTNTAARIGFDPFIEHNAEIISLRICCKPTSEDAYAQEIQMDISPDSTHFTLLNLRERTQYSVTIYAITEEYLIENHCRDVLNLPKVLKPSYWLSNKSFEFTSSGYELEGKINVIEATPESIRLSWTLPKVYGSTEYVRQVLRWRLDKGGEEHRKELDKNVSQAKIPGRLPSGTYKISIDSFFSVAINLENDNNETSRKEVRLTATETVIIHLHIPVTFDPITIYLTGYTNRTVNLAWNRPYLFSIIDHPERINEQLKVHRQLICYKMNIDGSQYNVLEGDQCQCSLIDCEPDRDYNVQLFVRTRIQSEYMTDMVNSEEYNNNDEPDETPSRKLKFRVLKDNDLLTSFRANFEFNDMASDASATYTSQENEIPPIGKIKVQWTVANVANILQYIIHWRSSKDLNTQNKIIASNETSTTIDAFDEKHDCTIGIIIVTKDHENLHHETLTIAVPGAPDAPSLWLVKSSDTSFTVEWSEPRTYGIPIIGYQLFVEGKKKGDLVQVNLLRAEIPSRINRTYQVNVCAVTSNVLRPSSIRSQTLSVITTPTTNLVPTIYYSNDDGDPTSLDSTAARIIPVTIEPVNEEKLHIDWTSFLPTTEVRAYYVQYTCLNNGEVQTVKVSKRFRQYVLRGLRPGFTYGIIVLAANKHGTILYTSDKTTIQMNAPPNAPIVAITERTIERVKFEWRPAASYGEVTVAGYKVFINGRLAATLAPNQLSYTLTNGVPCDKYTVNVQAISNDKSVASPMSREIQFAWRGIKPGVFRRLDNGQIGAVIVAWEHPQFEDPTEKLIGYKLMSENLLTHAVRLHGEYDAGINQATIMDLNNGKYRLWLEIQGEHNRTRSRPIMIVSGRFNQLRMPRTSSDAARCFMKRKQRFRSPANNSLMPPIRHSSYS